MTEKAMSVRWTLSKRRRKISHTVPFNHCELGMQMFHNHSSRQRLHISAAKWFNLAILSSSRLKPYGALDKSNRGALMLKYLSSGEDVRRFGKARMRCEVELRQVLPVNKRSIPNMCDRVRNSKNTSDGAYYSQVYGGF